ncbi:hypothetical protein DFH07DRAFT_1013083 [Mycena maculata]|uniref:Phosphodiester glycosidase domain-containing protein n=1 Tax=Mycena maculata TaxID=230809 RepID=A0AAD7HCP6_9AGAR|nr:hypothetical protein DFH07DRAFT_1013083 [Mycena maculata]
MALALLAIHKPNLVARPASTAPSSSHNNAYTSSSFSATAEYSVIVTSSLTWNYDTCNANLGFRLVPEVDTTVVEWLRSDNADKHPEADVGSQPAVSLSTQCISPSIFLPPSAPSFMAGSGFVRHRRPIPVAPVQQCCWFKSNTSLCILHTEFYAEFASLAREPLPGHNRSYGDQISGTGSDSVRSQAHASNAQEETFNRLLGLELVQWITGHPDQVGVPSRLKASLTSFSAEMRLLAPGLVYVRIHGDSRTFSAVRIDNVTDSNGEQDLRFLTACGETYGLHVIGGNRLYTAASRDAPMSAFGGIIQEELDRVGFASADVSVFAYVNGGFYNRRNPKFPNSTADENEPEHATIGITRTSEGVQLPSIVPPIEYAADYGTINLTGQAVITGAPVIARDGKPTFTEQDMTEERFKYDPTNITPGLLNHAEHPNPRTAIIVPTSPGRYAHYRFLTALTTTQKRGSGGTGFTMIEWARVAARLSMLEAGEGSSTPTICVNLDGGASTVMGADLKGQKLLDVRQQELTRTPYFIAVAPK